MMHLTVIFKSTIMCQQFYSLFILFTFLTTNALAIKVDFNTNTGPIIPPTSTEAPVPKPPFREPAPVWEDQSDDIPNPHPYKYVAPPTTRPRYNDPFGDKSVQRSTVPPQHGNIVYHPNQIHDQNNKIVNSLTVKYIPNYGNKYVAVVPATTKVQYLNNNEIYDNLSNDNNNYYDNNNNNNNNNYNNKNVNNFNNNDYNYNYYDDISPNKYDKYHKYEKYDNLQKSNSKYRLKNKKYNAYEEKKKYWPIYLYHIPHQQQVYVYNYQT